jgi:hypothetical protein
VDLSSYGLMAHRQRKVDHGDPYDAYFRAEKNRPMTHSLLQNHSGYSRPIGLRGNASGMLRPRTVQNQNPLFHSGAGFNPRTPVSNFGENHTSMRTPVDRDSNLDSPGYKMQHVVGDSNSNSNRKISGLGN